jgi:RNA polymerase sigma-70 factor (ECF subfamily)
MSRESVRRNEEELPEEFSLPGAARACEHMDIEQSIARLPAGYRLVLVLHDVEGYTHEEIGARLEISAGTSKSQLHHARKALRAAFQGK